MAGAIPEMRVEFDNVEQPRGFDAPSDVFGVAGSCRSLISGFDRYRVRICT
jgi:hypothetical protein